MSNRKVRSPQAHLPIVLPFPVSPQLRLAQLSPGPTFANIQRFVLKRWSDLQLLAPNIVAGTLAEMQSLVEQVHCGAVGITSVDRALIILTRFGVKPLNDVHRVALWQSFGVPLFELYLGLDQSLIAAECEAHEGWHLVSNIQPTTLETGELILDGAGNSGLRTGLRARIDRTKCPCGQKTPRLLEIEQPRRFESSRYLAVSA